MPILYYVKQKIQNIDPEINEPLEIIESVCEKVLNTPMQILLAPYQVSQLQESLESAADDILVYFCTRTLAEISEKAFHKDKLYFLHFQHI